MKKIRKSRTAIIPSVSLYLEDVQDILAILKEECKSINITDRDYTYESLEQLIERRGSRPSALEIIAREPYLSIRFDRGENPTSTWLYAENTEQAEVVFFKIQELLLRRKKWLNYVVRLDISLAAFLTMILAAVAVTLGWLPRTNIWSFVIPIVLLYSLVALFLRTGTLYSVTLKKRHEMTSFWQRNGENIILVILGTIIGAVGQWLVSQFLK